MMNSKSGGGTNSFYKKIEFVYFTTMQENKQEESKIMEQPKIPQKSLVINVSNTVNQNFKSFLNSQFSKLSKEQNFQKDKEQIQENQAATNPVVHDYKKLNILSKTFITKQNKLARLIFYKIQYRNRGDLSKFLDIKIPDAKPLNIKIKTFDCMDRGYSQWNSKENKLLNSSIQAQYKGLLELQEQSKEKDQYDKDYDKGKLKKIRKKKAQPQILDFQKIVRRQQRELLKQNQEDEQN